MTDEETLQVMVTEALQDLGRRPQVSAPSVLLTALAREAYELGRERQREVDADEAQERE